MTSDGPREHFGCKVPESLVASWRSYVGQRQVIGQAEIFPALVARLTWIRRLEGRRCIYFIDNDSARVALVKQYSPVLSSLRILIQCTTLDALHLMVPWYARVPTASNPADGPSRLDDKDLRAVGSKPVACRFPDGTTLDFGM